MRFKSILEKNFLKKFFFTTVVIFLLVGCSPPSRAPIVNGWQQPAANHSTYIVQRGDTLYSIAWAFEMDFRDLASINHLSPPYALRAGQKLNMSYSTVAAVITMPMRSTTQFIAESRKMLPQPKPYHQKQMPIPPPTRTVVSLPSQFNGHWLWPVRGKIVRGFSLIPGGTRGIEIAGRLGSPIVASAPGTVVYSGSGLRGYGNLIIIKHNDTYLSAYAYNKRLLVKEGSVVRAGQTIALMGSNTAGQVRLHFEIRQNGKPVNPMKFLRE